MMYVVQTGCRYQPYYTLVNIIRMRCGLPAPAVPFMQRFRLLVELNTLVQSYSSSNRNAKHTIDDAPFAFFQSCIFRKHFKTTDHAAPT